MAFTENDSLISVTTDEVAQWLGVTTPSLPQEVNQRMLNRAYDVIEEASMGRPSQADPIEDAKMIDRLKRAVCAQIEYWLNTDEAVDIVGTSSEVRVLGRFQKIGKDPILAPRARRELFLGGLLSRRIFAGGYRSVAFAFFRREYDSKNGWL